MVVFLLCSDDLEVEQVTLQLPVARGRVPSGWRDNLEASELGRLLPGGRVKNIERKVGRRSPGQDEVWRCAVHRLWPCSLFLHHVPSTHSVQEAQAGTVHAIVGVAGIDGLKKISYMTHMDAGFAHRVRFFDHLYQAALLQPLNSLELSKIVKSVAIELKREASAVAGVLPVHQQLVDLLHQLHGGNLDVKGLNSRCCHLYREAKVLRGKSDDKQGRNYSYYTLLLLHKVKSYQLSHTQDRTV